jgi:D-alanine-D-alanine ligase
VPINVVLERGIMSRKLRVGVIFGGRSGEHEVSLRSVRSVMAAMDKDKYEIVPIGITKEGLWMMGEEAIALLTDGRGEAMSALVVPEPGQRSVKSLEPIKGEAGAYHLRDQALVDVVFPVLHGPYGEDGTVQGLLELAGIPYVGAGVVGSAVGMDKAIFKSVMVAHDLPVLPYQLVLRSAWESDQERVLDRVEAALPYPMFVKPVNLGSSVGVNKARDRKELIASLHDAAQYDRRLLIEKGILAREIEVSVLGNDDPEASIPGEVVPGDEFYSYVDKYINDEAQLLIPAPLTEAQAQEARQMAIAAYKAMDCAGLARCDFLMDRDTDEIWINEVNTIPGFTSISMYPKLWEATGLPYPILIDRLIELAMERYDQKCRCKTSYEPPTKPSCE